MYKIVHVTLGCVPAERSECLWDPAWGWGSGWGLGVGLTGKEPPAPIHLTEPLEASAMAMGPSGVHHADDMPVEKSASSAGPSDAPTFPHFPASVLTMPASHDVRDLHHLDTHAEGPVEACIAHCMPIIKHDAGLFLAECILDPLARELMKPALQ